MVTIVGHDAGQAGQDGGTKKRSKGAIVTIVVGWELCWYRYEVDLADEAAGVRQTAQGDELTELDDPDTVPNAAADDRGELQLVSV